MANNSNVNRGPGRPPGVKNDPNRAKSALHPRLGMTWKRALKLEKVARLSMDPANYTNEQIANFIGCDKQTVVLIRQTPQYHAKVMEVAAGITSSWDEDLRTDTENMRAEMKSMVPSAMMVIRNSLTSKDERIRVKMAMEVLNREGTLAPVSKSTVTVKTAANTEVDATTAANLMTLLASAPVTTDAQVTAGAAPGFTTSASADKDQQVTGRVENEALLVELDLLNKKPN